MMAQKSLLVAIALLLAVSVQGLELSPMPQESNVKSALIWIKANDTENVNYWTNEINNFLRPYLETPLGVNNRVPCVYNSPPGEGKVCNVPVETWMPCIAKNKYNYHQSAPCIFLKWNEIYNWKPDTYNDTNALPTEMPEDVKHHIDAQKFHPQWADTVWVSCEGENPVDIENIGPIQYIPQRGFPGYFFPFTNLDNYLNPLMAVLFERPMRGIVINIKCKAWAKNIKHDQHDRRGSVRFELLVD